MSREAMKLALEALEEGLDDYWRETNPLGNQAITALKQVLEQPEPEPVALPEKIYEFVPTPEPAKWHHPECEGQCFACLIEQVVQEAYGSQGLGYLQRHLTTSPKRKPLTDEEIADLWSAQIFHIVDLKLAKDFVRDIEAAHGIKGEA